MHFENRIQFINIPNGQNVVVLIVKQVVNCYLKGKKNVTAQQFDIKVSSKKGNFHNLTDEEVREMAGRY